MSPRVARSSRPDSSQPACLPAYLPACLPACSPRAHCERIRAPTSDRRTDRPNIVRLVQQPITIPARARLSRRVHLRARKRAYLSGRACCCWRIPSAFRKSRPHRGRIPRASLARGFFITLLVVGVLVVSCVRRTSESPLFAPTNSWPAGRLALLLGGRVRPLARSPSSVSEKRLRRHCGRPFGRQIVRPEWDRPVGRPCRPANT